MVTSPYLCREFLRPQLIFWRNFVHLTIVGGKYEIHHFLVRISNFISVYWGVFLLFLFIYITCFVLLSPCYYLFLASLPSFLFSLFLSFFSFIRSCLLRLFTNDNKNNMFFSKIFFSSDFYTCKNSS